MLTARGYLRFSIALFMTILSVMIFGSLAALYLIATPSGGKMVVGYALKKYGSVASLSVGHYEGSITQGFILKDITLKRLPYYPEAVTKIQQAEVKVPLGIPDWHKVTINILNARIFLSQSDPIVFSGTIMNGSLEGNVFTRTLDVAQLSHSFMAPENRKNVYGFVTGVDLLIQGPLLAPHLSGHFMVDKIIYKTTTVYDAFGRIDLNVVEWGEKPQVKGEVSISSGMVIARHISLDLQTSKVYFIEDTYNPRLDIHAGTQVKGVEIDMSLKGTYLKPQLSLSSDPPLSEDMIVLMLMTGKGSKSARSSFTGGTLSGEIAGDFMDYFLLGDSGTDFSRQYGATDSEESKKVGLSKRLTDEVKVGFGVEQVPSQFGLPTSYSKTVEGEMAVTDGLSLNVSKKLLTVEEAATTNPQQQGQQTGETQIYLKYKRNF